MWRWLGGGGDIPSLLGPLRRVAGTNGSGGPSNLPVAFDEERVLPSQWEIPARQESGEQRLMRAILEQALHDLKQPDGPHYGDACAWFASAETSHLYAFENVCDVLGFDVGIMRREIRARGAGIARRIRPRWASSRPRVTLNEPVLSAKGSRFGFKNR